MKLQDLYDVIVDRRDNPREASYTSSLLEQGENAVLRKFGEEATELMLAAKDDEQEEIVHESADIVYHLLVLMAANDVEFDALMEELEERRG